MACVVAILDVALNMTAHITLQRSPVLVVLVFQEKGDTYVNDGQHKTMLQLNLDFHWAVVHLTYFMSLFFCVLTVTQMILSGRKHPV